ncbi:MAG TPA: hypothetical protein VKA15_27465, partial [Isosphaeraceae bacterium]|nr:hypothetical protein [Isosphaeraceae bacterium]
MGLAEIERALARLYVDVSLRNRLAGDPASVGAEFRLTVPETQRLSSIPSRQLEQFAESLLRKRASQVSRIVPMTACALGARYSKWFERYATAAPPRGSRADVGDAVGFVDALVRFGPEVEPPWAADLARYELAWFRFAQSRQWLAVQAFDYPVLR